MDIESEWEPHPIILHRQHIGLRGLATKADPNGATPTVRKGVFHPIRKQFMEQQAARNRGLKVKRQRLDTDFQRDAVLTKAV